jgi:hypothetical protein
VEHSNLPRGATFRGNLLSRLTLVERSQPEGVFLVDGIAFGEQTTRLLTTSGHSVSMPAWSTAEEIHDAIATVTSLKPVDTECWQSFPPNMTTWAAWLTLHYDLASVERDLDLIVPGLHLREIRREGEFARIATQCGQECFQHEVPLTEQPLAIPVDLAFDVLRRRH